MDGRSLFVIHFKTSCIEISSDSRSVQGRFYFVVELVHSSNVKAFQFVSSQTGQKRKKESTAEKPSLH